MKIGQRFDAPYEMPITQVGESPTYLPLSSKAVLEVEKEGNSFEIGPRVFVGELAFLMVKAGLGHRASVAGAHCIRWPVRDLFGLVTAPSAGDRSRI